MTFRPFVAIFDPYARAAWLEPIQAFVLHWEAWPKHSADGGVTWFEEDDNSLPVEIARWKVERYEQHTTLGRLEVRRDRLLSLLATFDFDLAIYHEESIDSNLPDGLRDNGRERFRAWQVRTAKVSGGLPPGIARRLQASRTRSAWTGILGERFDLRIRHTPF